MQVCTAVSRCIGVWNVAVDRYITRSEASGRALPTARRSLPACSPRRQPWRYMSSGLHYYTYELKRSIHVRNLWTVLDYRLHFRIVLYFFYIIFFYKMGVSDVNEASAAKPGEIFILFYTLKFKTKINSSHHKNIYFIIIW